LQAEVLVLLISPLIMLLQVGRAAAAATLEVLELVVALGFLILAEGVPLE
jgi:hypothetical protein